MNRLRTLARSFRLYLTIMFPYRTIHFRLSRRPDVVIAEHELRAGGRRLLPDVYRSGRDGRRRPAIIIYVPLAQEGKRDRLVTNFMQGMARLGYVVLVPFWPNRPRGAMAMTDAEDLAASIAWLKKRPDVDPQRIGVVAVSYGVGPALLVAGSGRYRTGIQFIAAIGGYAEMKNLARFALTGTFEYGPIRDRLPPDPYLKEVIATAAARWGNRPAIQSLLAARTPEAFAAAYDRLPAAIKEWFRELSPTTHLHQFSTPLLILHSTNDTLVPYTESLRLYDAVRTKPRTSLTLVNVFHHTIPIPATPANLVRVYLPNLWRVVRYIYQILAFQEE